MRAAREASESHRAPMAKRWGSHLQAMGGSYGDFMVMFSQKKWDLDGIKWICKDLYEIIVILYNFIPTVVSFSSKDWELWWFSLILFKQNLSCVYRVSGNQALRSDGFALKSVLGLAWT